MNKKLKNYLKHILPKFIIEIIKYFIRLYNEMCSHFLSDDFQCFLYKCYDFSRRFNFNGKSYSYFISRYNTTWKNERIVEIPIIQKYLRLYKNKNILEIGNVMNHYYRYNHIVVDKYEIGSNVINCDILNYPPNSVDGYQSDICNMFDLIISISTLEHISFDEKKYNNRNIEIYTKDISQIIEKIKSLLVSNGTFVFTVPLGFNPYLDNCINKSELNITKMFFLKRTSKSNTWEQVEYQEVKDIKYGSPFPCANAIMIGIFNKEKTS